MGVSRLRRLGISDLVEDDTIPTGGGDAALLRDEAEAQPTQPGFLPASPPRASVESIIVRLIATAGVIGIGTAAGAILGASNLAGWIIGLVVSTLSVILAAVLWRSRRM